MTAATGGYSVAVSGQIRLLGLRTTHEQCAAEVGGKSYVRISQKSLKSFSSSPKLLW